MTSLYGLHCTAFTAGLLKPPPAMRIRLLRPFCLHPLPAGRPSTGNSNHQVLLHRWSHFPLLYHLPADLTLRVNINAESVPTHRKGPGQSPALAARPALHAVLARVHSGVCQWEEEPCLAGVA